MKRINLNKLFYFYMVAKEGSIKDASAKLFLSQPTISVQIKSLEYDLGFKVFNREHKKIVLSEKGAHLLKKAEKIFMLADELVDELPQMGLRSREKFRIGALNSVSAAFISDFSIDLWKDKTIAPSVIHGNYASIKWALDNAQIDLALADESFGAQKNYKSICLGSDRLVVVATKAYKSYIEGFPQSLNGLPYVSFLNEGHTQSEINYYFSRENINPEVIGTVDDIALIRTIARQGICFAVLPHESVKFYLDNGTLIKLGELSEITFYLWGIFPSHSENRKLIKKIISQYFKKSR